MRRPWFLPIQSVATVIVVSAVTLLYGDAQATQEVVTEAPVCVYNTIQEPSCLLDDEALDKSIRFQKLLREWHEQRGSMSWMSDIAMCPAYQSIIGIGPPVVPLILAQLRSEGDEPDHWFWALRVITEVNPVAEQDQGDVTKMAEAWLQWGAQQGYAG
jgi:hypothetical protein